MTYLQIDEFLDKCESLYPEVFKIEVVATHNGQFWPNKRTFPNYSDVRKYCAGFISGAAEKRIEPHIAMRVITNYAERELTLREEK
jgi:hypothetical protein